jgi:maltodextrin utilization protein YvdJ
MIPLKKPEMQGAKFSRNKAYLAYVTVTGKLKQRRRLGFFSGINIRIFFMSLMIIPLVLSFKRKTGGQYFKVRGV